MDQLLFRRLCPFVAASLFLALMAVFWHFGVTGPYYDIVRLWGIEPYRYPFLDTDTILSAVRCTQAGVDVYAANPCDPLHRVYDYSPLWLVIAHVPGPGNWITPIGLGFDIAFLFALLLLPPGRTGGDAWLITVGVISSAAMFALERGNNDLIVFALAVVAADLSCRSRGVRLIGYGAALLAGLLKYFPMLVLALAMRERPRRLFVIAAAVMAVLVLFIAIMGRDLLRALALVPGGSWIGDMYGSSTLAGGLFSIFSAATSPGRTFLQAAMTIAVLMIAVQRGRRPALAADLRMLGERERAFLLTGAMLTLACFFTAQNIGYRAIHLILILPALAALRRTAPDGSRYTWMVAATVLLLWAEGWRQMVRHASGYLAPDDQLGLMLAAWLCREALWWSTITALASFAVALLLETDIVRAIAGMVRRDVRHPVVA